MVWTRHCLSPGVLLNVVLQRVCILENKSYGCIWSFQWFYIKLKGVTMSLSFCGFTCYSRASKYIASLLTNTYTGLASHDDVIKWKHFPRYWPFVRGIHWSLVNSPHKGQWRGALMLSLIRAWINGWVNNGEACDLKRHRAHHDVTVMWSMWEGQSLLIINQLDINDRCMVAPERWLYSVWPGKLLN